MKSGNNFIFEATMMDLPVTLYDTFERVIHLSTTNILFVCVSVRVHVSFSSVANHFSSFWSYRFSVLISLVFMC